MSDHAPIEPRFRPLELLRTLRPRQWAKNAFLLAPLVFARHLFSVSDLGRALLAWLLFSLVAGSVYILNDVQDLAEDRAHPTKRFRPLAAGRLRVPDALVAMGALLAAALFGMAWLSVPAATLTAGYFLLNVAYSRTLKHLAYIDVVTIATGFLLRVLVGALVVAVPITHWLLACTFLVAFFLGLGKRRHELHLLQSTGQSKRRVLASYQLRHLDVLLWGSGAVTTLSYLAYTLDPATVDKFGTPHLVWTTVFIAAGVARFGRLVVREGDPVSPTDAMLRDGPFLANLAGWAVAVVIVLYGFATPPAPVSTPTPPPAIESRVAPAPAAKVVPPPERQDITLRVRSVPYGAEVRLDGQVLGVTPLQRAVPAAPGKRHLSLHLAGYEVREMDVVLDQDVGFGLNLKKLQAEAP